MKTTSLFEFDSYKKAMSYLLLKEGKRGSISRAAELLGCQPSFLSRVISAEIHLTPDHAFMLSRFWNLNFEERDYFQTMVEHERASKNQYKIFLAEKLKELRQNHESLQKRTKKEAFPIAEQEALYFSSWHWSAIHFLVSIPKYQSVPVLAQRINLPESLTLNYLRQLARFGLVKENKNKWEYAGGQFHIPKNSPFVVLHHQNWRARATLDSQDYSNDSIHYTSVLTLSKSDLVKLKEILLKFITESDELARPSEPEESVILTCDLFKT